MEYLNKFYIKHIEKKNEDEFFDDKVRKIKMKNCCKRWNSNMNNKNILIDYKKEIDENFFLKNLERAWALFFSAEEKGNILFHKEENIYSLPNFLIIDNTNNNNSSTNNNDNTDDNKCDNNYILDENDGKKISTNKNIYLNKKFINIYYKHNDTSSFYDKEIDDFLKLPDILTNYNEEINTINIYDDNFNIKNSLIINKNEITEDNEENIIIKEKITSNSLNKSIIINENDNSLSSNEQNVTKSNQQSDLSDNDENKN